MPSLPGDPFAHITERIEDTGSCVLREIVLQHGRSFSGRCRVIAVETEWLVLSPQMDREATQTVWVWVRRLDIIRMVVE